MQAAILPASAGWQWSRDGFLLFRKQPLAMFMWAMAVSLAVTLAFLAAPIGPFLFVALMPVVTLLTMNACRHIASERVILPSMWFKPLQPAGTFRRLFGMGMMYVAVSLIAGLVAFLPFLSNIADSIEEAQATQTAIPMLEAMGPGIIIFGILYVMIAALFWHAPVLVAWHHLRLSQSLFFSAIACWRNKWPFLVYGIVWFSIFFAIDLVFGILVWMGIPVGVAQMLKMPANIAAMATLYCSFYPAYVSVFDIIERPPHALDAPDHQEDNV